MHRIMVIFVVLAFLISGGSAYTQEIWVAKDGSIRNVDTRALIIDGQWRYLATSGEVYCSRGEDGRWESIFTLPPGENEITCLGGIKNRIIIGTRRGLFRSEDGGRNWRSIFRTIIPEKNNVVALEVSVYDPKKVVIATRKGVFISEDFGNRWRDISHNLKNKSINCIALNKDLIYAGGEDGLYRRSADSLGWERVYVKSSSGDSDAGEPAQETEALAEDRPEGVNCIAVDGSVLYAGSGKDILYSEDTGKSWKCFANDGLSGAVNYILFSKKKDNVYCATTKGIYEFSRDRSRWLELYMGMSKPVVTNSLVAADDESASLWAVTEKGIYRLEAGSYAGEHYIDVERNLKTLKILFSGEPSYVQLQKAALRFNEVDPEKIRRWRNEARLRALLPKVSLGVDRDRSTNSEIYTSASREYIFVGPDDESSGVDVSVSWELGDLIWSDDQTNIDVRSRLTTQLRNDILDDLRRVYYERRRLQFELIDSPPGDMKLRFERELRIKELTQAIDDLTGNYLSENMEEKNLLEACK